MHYHKSGHHVHILCCSDRQSMAINYRFGLPKNYCVSFPMAQEQVQKSGQYVCLCFCGLFSSISPWLQWNSKTWMHDMFQYSSHHCLVLSYICPSIQSETCRQCAGSGLREPHWRPLEVPKTHFKESRVFTHSTHRRTICLSTSDMDRRTFFALSVYIRFEKHSNDLYAY